MNLFETVLVASFAGSVSAGFITLGVGGYLVKKKLAVAKNPMNPETMMEAADDMIGGLVENLEEEGEDKNE